MTVPFEEDESLAATLEKELVRARVERALFQREAPVKLGRFEVLRCIGRGSLGVVYEARNPDHGGRVALKLLSRVDGQTIAQFKHEFRVLSGISHPNLVALHELVCERDHWFVSMELIEGVPFDRWLWSYPEAPLDPTRLRSALAQLLAAVTAIHRAGKLHRDLKPSNVLVTAAGRVVVLDFGLVSARDVEPAAGPAALVGTPGYMAPEQAAREPACEASDFYAIGVMLFEALTHRLPFDGLARDVLRKKRARAAPRVRDFAPEVPLELDALCRALLERDPAQRAGASAIEAWLGRSRLPEKRFSAVADAAPPPPLVGRDAELSLLLAELDAARAGRSAIVWLRAAPGLGKSAILDAFAARAPAPALVLRGKCHEGESIPFKVFDAIADALRDALDSPSVAPHVQVSADDAAVLVQTFPGFGQSATLARLAGATTVGVEEAERFHRAFAAWKRLLAALARMRPLAIAIDDLQWGDEDSGRRFGEMFGGQDAPACLFVGTFRGDDPLGCSFVRSAGIRAATLLELEPLPPTAANELARQMLRARGMPATPELSRRLARETGGVPLLLAELARHTARPRRGSTSRPSSTGAVALQTALRARIAGLPERARRLLAIVCVAPEPLPLRVALAAAGLPADEHLALASICTEHLARRSGGRPIDTLEPFHERVRKAVLQSLPVAERLTLEAELSAARLVAESGDEREAASQAERAAAAALHAREAPNARALAVRVLALLEPDSPRRRELQELLDS